MDLSKIFILLLASVATTQGYCKHHVCTELGGEDSSEVVPDPQSSQEEFDIKLDIELDDFQHE